MDSLVPLELEELSDWPAPFPRRDRRNLYTAKTRPLTHYFWETGALRSVNRSSITYSHCLYVGCRNPFGRLYATPKQSLLDHSTVDGWMLKRCDRCKNDMLKSEMVLEQKVISTHLQQLEPN
jgi:hypothetical protein